ncbi:MAG: efflux RND transporter periplasmic adaptor subunit [Chlorobi bacterium]|nr:MAG: membrane-fusion protein [Chlorobi bacterium OLB7]MBK8912570.1 efflux RND transporter periplasmic adaptor subunit [Chlorobiota bacterium]MBX7216377.1 efflux RND transporter periplasmic adaptor subunit [Candidatus Kapabacteria bacterium]
MKRVITIVVTSLIISLLGYGGYSLLMSNKAQSEAKAKSVTVKPFAVAVATVGSQELSSDLSLVGTMIASREVNIASEIMGRVRSVNMELGQAKGAGSLLITIDDELKRTALEQAKISLEKAKKEYERVQMVQVENALPDQTLDNAKWAVQLAETQVAAAERQVRDARISAPISGTVTAKMVEVGSMVQPGQVLGTIVDLANLKLRINVPEKDVFSLKVGDPVEITTEVYPGVTLEGRIKAIIGKADEAHTYPVEITIPNNRTHPLKAGMFGRASFTSLPKRTSMVIPRAAVIGSVKNAQVYVVNGTTVRLRNVVLGEEIGTNVEVLSGLKEGEQVVSTGQNNLRDSMQVEVMK